MHIHWHRWGSRVADDRGLAEYVPELRGVPAENVHQRHELSEAERAELAPGDPASIVDHADRRDEAIATFERERGEE